MTMLDAPVVYTVETSDCKSILAEYSITEREKPRHRQTSEPLCSSLWRVWVNSTSAEKIGIRLEGSCISPLESSLVHA
jgi:hypothetical protein